MDLKRKFSYKDSFEKRTTDPRRMMTEIEDELVSLRLFVIRKTTV